MIVTKKKDIEEVIELLEGVKSVYLFGCNACAEQCQTGGPEELKQMAADLESSGIKVAGSSLVSETCYEQLVRKEFRKKEEIKGADAIVVLSCGAGVTTVAKVADETQPVFPALDTIFLSTVERYGRFFEGCSLCGECVLGATGAICPHTECPKGLLNGPCGGVDGGMCEVTPDNECAWIRIYRRLKAQGRLQVLRKIAMPKDHSVLTRPRNVLLREIRRSVIGGGKKR